MIVFLQVCAKAFSTALHAAMGPRRFLFRRGVPMTPSVVKIRLL